VQGPGATVKHSLAVLDPSKPYMPSQNAPDCPLILSVHAKRVQARRLWPRGLGAALRGALGCGRRLADVSIVPAHRTGRRRDWGAVSRAGKFAGAGESRCSLRPTCAQDFRLPSSLGTSALGIARLLLASGLSREPQAATGRHALICVHLRPSAVPLQLRFSVPAVVSLADASNPLRVLNPWLARV